MHQDPVLGRRGVRRSLGPFLPPHIHPRGLPGPLGSAPASFCRGCSPGTMPGEAKGTAWPESCWSLVTCAKEEGPDVRGGWVQEGCLGLWPLTSAGVTAPY